MFLIVYRTFCENFFRILNKHFKVLNIRQNKIQRKSRRNSKYFEFILVFGFSEEV